MSEHSYVSEEEDLLAPPSPLAQSKMAPEELEHLMEKSELFSVAESEDFALLQEGDYEAYIERLKHKNA